MSNAPLPDWVFDGRAGVHDKDGSYSPASQGAGRRARPTRSMRASASRIRCWARSSRRAARCSRTTASACGPTRATTSPWSASRPRCTRSTITCSTALQEAVAIAERDFAGLVIWQPKEPFSAGADLAGALGLLQAGDVKGFEAMVANFQATSQRIKYSLVPVVAAVRGLALGRRLRVPDALGQDRVRAGKLHRPGRGGRRPAAGRRWPEGDRRARRRSGRSGRRRVRPAQDRVRERRDGQGVGIGVRSARTEARPRQRRGRLQRVRTAARRQGSRHARWPNPATARPCPRAASRSPAMSASRPSR